MPAYLAVTSITGCSSRATSASPNAERCIVRTASSGCFEYFAKIGAVSSG
jgi:hypothetical protein